MDTAELVALARQSHPWRARMYRAAGLTVVAATFTPIPFDTIDFDPNGNLVLGAAAAYTCPQDGYYSLSGSFCGVTSTAAGQVLLLSVWLSPAAGGGYAEIRRSPYYAAEAAAIAVGNSFYDPGIACFQGDQLQLRYYCSAALTAIATGSAFEWATWEWRGPR